MIVTDDNDLMPANEADKQVLQWLARTMLAYVAEANWIGTWREHAFRDAPDRCTIEWDEEKAGVVISLRDHSTLMKFTAFNFTIVDQSGENAKSDLLDFLWEIEDDLVKEAEEEEDALFEKRNTEQQN